MGKVIAIGGGSIGQPGTQVETEGIDREIIRQTGKKNPKLLFIPTASNDSEGYVDIVKKHFSRFGCSVDSLLLIRGKPSERETREKIFSSDIIYVGGGNTLKMIDKWKEFGVDKMLRQAHSKGIVLSGLSAGAICWFREGNSDSKLEEIGKLIKVSGLGFFDAMFCPHYDAEKNRKPALKEMTKSYEGFAIAVDNCCAIEIIDGKYRIIKSRPSAGAYRVYWKNNEFFEEVISAEKDFKSLESLLA